MSIERGPNVEAKSLNDAEAVTLRRDAWGRLLLSRSGQTEPIPVDPVRCFPLTHPREHVSLLDGEGKEVLRIASLDRLPDAQRSLLEEVLAEQEFSPEILRIRAIGASSPPCPWDVETDRGPTHFELDSEDDVRRLPDGTVIVVDSNGIRFRIRDVERLDAKSRAVLRRYL